MADKEATVFIIDVGSSMGNCNNGRIESDLDWSMRYVWDKLTTIVAASRKTLTVGVLGLRTDDTSNKMQEDDGYENISVLQDISPLTMQSLKKLQGSISPSETETGDAISAVVIAVDMIETFTKKLKYKRQIYLITDGTAPIDGDDFEDISQKMNDIGIQLTVL
jgi:ATP-dependent DNA helicase 2 subunit 2